MKPECKTIAYSITPEHQPEIKFDKYYCKYCGIEVKPELVLSMRIGWMHVIEEEEIIVEDKLDNYLQLKEYTVDIEDNIAYYICNTCNFTCQFYRENMIKFNNHKCENHGIKED